VRKWRAAGNGAVVLAGPLPVVRSQRRAEIPTVGPRLQADRAVQAALKAGNCSEAQPCRLPDPASEDC